MCVGNVTLDVVNRVDAYPAEDSEIRAVSQETRIGGNAANTAIVLSQLGMRVEWIGNLPMATPLIADSFARFGVGYDLANPVGNHPAPTSYITLSLATGSRSIIHHRAMPEYSAELFEKIDLTGFDWVHFEGRAVQQLARMMKHVRCFSNVRMSLEIEKQRVGIEPLMDDADLLLCSRPYAEARGCADPGSLLAKLPQGRRRTCTWGSDGAWGMDEIGNVVHARPRGVAPIIDSIGAGDTFNAVMVQGCCLDRPIEACLRNAVDTASRQCTVDGLQLAGASKVVS